MPIRYPEGPMGALIAEGIKLCMATLSGSPGRRWCDRLPRGLSPPGREGCPKVIQFSLARTVRSVLVRQLASPVCL